MITRRFIVVIRGRWVLFFVIVWRVFFVLNRFALYVLKLVALILSTDLLSLRYNIISSFYLLDFYSPLQIFNFDSRAVSTSIFFDHSLSFDLPLVYIPHRGKCPNASPDTNNAHVGEAQARRGRDTADYDDCEDHEYRQLVVDVFLAPFDDLIVVDAA